MSGLRIFAKRRTRHGPNVMILPPTCNHAGRDHIHGLTASDSSGGGVPAAVIVSTGCSRVYGAVPGQPGRPYICGLTIILSRQCLRIRRAVTLTCALSMIPAAPNTPEVVKACCPLSPPLPRNHRMGASSEFSPVTPLWRSPGGRPPDQRTVRASRSHTNRTARCRPLGPADEDPAAQLSLTTPSVAGIEHQPRRAVGPVKHLQGCPSPGVARTA